MWPESERARRRRDELVDEIMRSRCLENPRVEAAMRKVPRHFFLPGRNLDVVYQDRAIVTKRRGRLPISSSSQPCVMATMLEQLDVEPGHSVLEIGGGTGYNTALLAELSTPGGSVVTVDIEEDLVKSARRNLRRAGFEDVQVVLGDGGLGYRLAAPYDRIMATVGVWYLPPPWVEQLRPSMRGPLLQPSLGAVGYRGSARPTIGSGRRSAIGRERRRTATRRGLPWPTSPRRYAAEEEASASGSGSKSRPRAAAALTTRPRCAIPWSARTRVRNRCAPPCYTNGW